uniref:Ubiquitin carboxyl-terminal hydrolase 36 n=1 Tax=Corvus moneduloides TaxID=1196302 RepID=A0A8C3H2U7_CORMO
MRALKLGFVPSEDASLPQPKAFPPKKGSLGAYKPGRSWEQWNRNLQHSKCASQSCGQAHLQPTARTQRLNMLSSNNIVSPLFKRRFPADIAEGRALPQSIVFPPEKICMDWQQRQRPGAGLFNLGNTCYINVILQCLTYTPPLANYLLSYEHSQSCQQQGFCMMCTMEEHVRKVLCSPASAILPGAVLRDLKFIGEEFEYGRQENAYKFLRCTLSAMQRACLSARHEKTDHQETTIIHQIFRGFMKSRVTCLSCQAVVDSYKAFLDISLDIRVRGLLGAFQHLAMCLVSRCKKKAAASKRVTVHRAPRVLMLCLERADQWTGTKISKFVEYPEYLDLRPYMSDTAGEPLLCSLYAIVVHSGDTCLEGHFLCYTKASNGLWYKMDDEFVDSCDTHTVLGQQAYLLFYGGASHQQGGSSVPQGLPGRIKVMHSQRNRARERARSRSPQWGSDLCSWVVSSTNDGNLTGRRRKRTSPFGHDRAPGDATAPGPYNRICQQAPVPRLAWVQTLPVQRELGRSSWQDYGLCSQVVEITNSYWSGCEHPRDARQTNTA